MHSCSSKTRPRAGRAARALFFSLPRAVRLFRTETCPKTTGKRTLAPRRRGREQVEHEGFRLPRAVRLFRTGLVPRRRDGKTHSCSSKTRPRAGRAGGFFSLPTLSDSSARDLSQDDGKTHSCSSKTRPRAGRTRGFSSSEGCPTLPHGTCPKTTGKRTLAPRRRGREQVEHEGFSVFPKAVRLFRTGLSRGDGKTHSCSSKTRPRAGRAGGFFSLPKAVRLFRAFLGERWRNSFVVLPAQGLVRAAGLEPARPKGQGILSPQRLPIPPRPLPFAVYNTIENFEDPDIAERCPRRKESRCSLRMFLLDVRPCIPITRNASRCSP